MIRSMTAPPSPAFASASTAARSPSALLTSANSALVCPNSTALASMAAPAVSGVLADMMDFFTNRLQMTPSPALLKAMLINGWSGSGGDCFPFYFKKAGVGPLIGMRTWGGVIGITDRGPLIDGGTVNVPEFGNANAQGQWDVENHGVPPDIEVEMDPKLVREIVLRTKRKSRKARNGCGYGS